MSSIAEQQLALLTAQGTALAQALKETGDPPDPENGAYKKRKKIIDKFFKQGMKKLRNEGKADKELSDHAKALAELDLTNKEYSKAYEFKSVTDAQDALRSIADDWVTGKSGRHGGNKFRQHHGGPYGCFMITADKTTNVATLWVAGDNTNDLPEDLAGACEIPDDDEPEAGEHDNDLALLIACAGQSIDAIKKMDAADRTTHAGKCAKDGNVKASDVSALAQKMNCPVEDNTKLRKLVWILGAFDLP
jgi:hypothetical protein